MASNLISDEAGRVSASFTIPTNARNGNRIVEMNDGVYLARTSLQINDPLVITRIERIIENRIIRVPVVQVVWRTQTIFVPRDPLAQTFSFTRNQVVTSVGLNFTAKDPSIPVTVQIRGVTTGLPNGVVFAEKVLAPSEISLSGETRIRFNDPFYAEANSSYAVVLLTNSTNYKVRTATLGKMGRWGIITRQTYMEGVLLESSNAETVEPSAVACYDKQKILAILRDSPGKNLACIALLARQVRDLRTLLEIRAIRSAPDRIMHYLLLHADAATMTVLLPEPSRTWPRTWP
jgi:hypothetical protein